MMREHRSPESIPEVGFIRLPDILAIYPISRSAWWEGVRTGHYPKAVKLSARCTAWRVEDIRALIARPYPQEQRHV